MVSSSEEASPSPSRWSKLARSFIGTMAQSESLEDAATKGGSSHDTGSPEMKKQLSSQDNIWFDVVRAAKAKQEADIAEWRRQAQAAKDDEDAEVNAAKQESAIAKAKEAAEVEQEQQRVAVAKAKEAAEVAEWTRQAQEAKARQAAELKAAKEAKAAAKAAKEAAKSTTLALRKD